MVEKKRYGLPVAAILFAVSLTLTLVYYLVDAEEGNYAGLYYMFSHPNHVTAILCCLLFLKRRDTMLLSTIGACTLGYLGSFANQLYIYNYYLRRYGDGWEADYTFTLITFVAYATLFLVALVLCEPSFIQKDMTKLRQVVRKLFFIPAVLLTIPLLIRWTDIAENGSEYFRYVGYEYLLLLTEEAVAMMAVLLLGKWLAYPKVTTVVVNPEMERCKKELALLQKTLDMGIITQEEYKIKKQQLLIKAHFEIAAENT